MTIKIKDVVAWLLAGVEPVNNSVDLLQFGDPEVDVKGIIVTFIATVEVIEQAIKSGANLIITHEGTFFSHHDSFESSLDQDQTYLEKKQLIEKSGIAIFRCHDHVHSYRPDGITEGLVNALEWHSYVTNQLTAATLITLPTAMTGTRIAEHIKSKLGMAFLRTAGDLSIVCKRIGLLVGYRGGGPTVIPLFEQYNLDLILYGEGPEWETPEYVRDAAYLGRSKALIVMGHAESEQPGMKLLTDRLKIRFPYIHIQFISVSPLFQVI